MADWSAVELFDNRAPTYEHGAVGRWHARIVDRAADAALAAMPVPLRILDVGCGTGALLRELLVRVPYGESFVGVDPAAAMLAVARRTCDPRIGLVRATADALPFDDASFDLVVTTTSFDHWPDQRAGVTELARVLQPHGRLVLVDLAARWLPQRDRARSPRAVRALLEAAGLELRRQETVQRLGLVLPLIRAFIASR